MRLAKRSTAFLRMFDKNFKFNYFTMLVHMFIRKGFRLRSYSVILNFISLIKTKFDNKINTILFNVFERYLPVISFISKKVAAITYQLPWFISKVKSQLLLLRWFIKSSFSRTEKTLSEKLYCEFMDLSSGYGKTVKILENYYDLAIKNRPFTRFIHKKRRVFLSRLKKFGIR